MFILMSNINYFDYITLEPLRPTINSLPVITVVVDSLKLYQSPNLNTDFNEYLLKNDLLFYLDYSFSNNDLKNRQIWYKVSKEDKKTIGWIKGDNKSVKFYTDGD